MGLKTLIMGENLLLCMRNTDFM